MSDFASQDEQALREQLKEARARIEGLACDLRAVDADLEGIAGEREQFQLLGQVCDGLDALEEQGAAHLFWGENALESRGEEYLSLARGRVAGFEKRLGEMEERRDEVVHAIQREEDRANLVAYDLDELRRIEEERKLEWIPEREASPLPLRATIMPWTRGGEDDQRFRKALALALLLSLLFGLVFPMINLPIPEPWETVEVPERLAQLIREERTLPPPPPQQQAQPQAKETETETAEQQEVPQPIPPKSPQADAASKGILAFREKFSGLTDDLAASRLGLNARIKGSGQQGTSRSERNMVATRAPGSSGGINLASMSRDIGGGGEGLQGVEVARATSSIGGGGGTSDRPLSGGPGASRTDEEIQIVFDRHKAALYRLYNRELRRDPTLQGQMVLRLTIEPDGSVSFCAVKSTDMKAPNLAAQVVERVKTFDFGAKDGIPAITILYPIDFLPAV